MARSVGQGLKNLEKKYKAAEKSYYTALGAGKAPSSSKGAKGGLMGGAKAGKGMPAKQMSKKKKTKKKVRGTQSTRRGY